MCPDAGAAKALPILWPGSRRFHGIAALAAACALGLAGPAESATDLSARELLDLPLEQLMQVSVTSVAGVEKDWFSSPAALFVISAEDLRRTGHRTLAEVLRMAPGVFVGGSSAHSWVVGMRGFSGGLANKTLVLIDGRAAYDPLFGGTFWDAQDILISDVERIEVIRGPGATLWGANAVNGVINVISKPAKDTQGAYLKTGAGNEERGFASARYGGKAGEKGFFRVWGKYFNRDDYPLRAGGSNNDKWDLGHGAFRLDYEIDDKTLATMDGGGYDLGFNEAVATPVPGVHRTFLKERGHGWANGTYLRGRVARETPGESGWSVQAYYDRTDRQQSANFEVERNTADVDFRHHFRVASWNEVLWGLGYRYTEDDTLSTPQIEFDPLGRSLRTFSGFVQDTVTIVDDRVFAMIGTKLEYNNFTDFEVQPSGRLWWTPNDRNTLWASISRPVRIPTRIERDATLTLAYVDTGLVAGLPESGVILPITVDGDRNLDSEKLLAYEIGHRIKLTPELTFDSALFYNDYSRLIFVPKAGSGTFTDEGSGETYGFELTGLWRALERWSLSSSYSFVEVQIHGPILPQDEGTAPAHQFKFRSYLDVTDWLELNTMLYYVSRVPSADADDYVRFDQGVTWKATKNVELSLWGQNLLDGKHREASAAVEVDRSVYVSATFQF